MLLVFFSLFLYFKPLSSELLLIDKSLKTPVKSASAYSFEDFMADRFPIHVADRKAFIIVLETAAKALENPATFHRPDTLFTQHSRLLLIPIAAGGGRLLVRLITQLDKNLQCDLTLVQGENRKRKVQQVLLDLRFYLSE